MKKTVYGILAMTMAMALCCVTACGGGKDDSSSLSSSVAESASSEETVTKIQLVQKEVELTVGSSVTLEAITSTPNVYVQWEIRKGEEHIASVKKGVVTGLSEGSTICYAKFGGQTAMCLIKVSAQVAQPQWSIYSPYAGETLTLNVGDTFNPLISLKLGDEVVNDDSLSYATANANVVKVEDGQLVAVGGGETTVTVTTSNSESAFVELTVTVIG